MPKREVRTESLKNSIMMERRISLRDFYFFISEKLNTKLIAQLAFIYKVLSTHVMRDL